MSIVLALIGCWRGAPYVVPEAAMPANTVMLSQMMRELSATPGFTDALLAELDKGGKKGPALLTPALVNRLRELILGRDWQGLDRFPGWTMQEINPAVRVAGRLVAKEDVAKLAARHPGAPVNALGTEQPKVFVDLGSYSLERAETVSLDHPSTLPPFTTEGLVSELGAGVVRGGWAESEACADACGEPAAGGCVEPVESEYAGGFWCCDC